MAEADSDSRQHRHRRRLSSSKQFLTAVKIYPPGTVSVPEPPTGGEVASPPVFIFGAGSDKNLNFRRRMSVAGEGAV